MHAQDKHEEEFKLVVQRQRRLNPIIKEVMRNEVLKLFEACMIYLIYDNYFVSVVCVDPKKGSMTVI